MPGQTYTIDFTDSSLPGKTPFTISPGTYDGPDNLDSSKRHTSINLFGQGYLRYGEKANENFLHLLENFASSTEPPTPTIGQLWFDSESNTLKVYDMNQNWVGIGGISLANQAQIVQAISSTKQFKIRGNKVSFFPNGSKFYVEGTGTANDGQIFTVSGTPTYDSNNNITTITVVESVADSGENGKVYYSQQPVTPTIGELWYDIEQQSLKVWKGSYWESIILQGGGSGGLTLNGNLDMSNTYRVINLASPVNSNDATTKQYVDNGLNTKLDKTGGTLTGNLIGTAFRALQGVPNNSDSSTNGFAFGVDGDTGLFSPIVGGGGANGVVSLFANNVEALRCTPTSITLNLSVTANNFITLHANPTNAMHAVTKQYVDNHISDQTLHLTPAQNTWIDAITVSSTEVNQLSGVTSNIQTQLNAKVNKAGDTMTGYLTLHADPTNAMHAATKQYVDNHAADQALHLTPTQNTWIDAITVSSTEVNQLSGVTSNIQTQLNAKVNKAGDTMTGYLTLHADPTNATHAATKQYVDNAVASISSGATLSSVAANTTYYLGLSATSSGAWTDARVDTSNLYYTSGNQTLYATNFNTSSDERLKENIHNIENSLELLSQIRGVGFTWKETGKKSYGVIAQEVEQVIPEIVDTSEHDRKSVNYNALIGFLIEAVKRLNEENVFLRNELEKIKK